MTIMLSTIISFVTHNNELHNKLNLQNDDIIGCVFFLKGVIFILLFLQNKI